MLPNPLYPESNKSTNLIGAPSARRKGLVRTVTMPDRVGPYVKLVFAEMARLRLRYDDIEFFSGVRRPTIKAWRKKNRPGLETMEAVLGSLGWNLVPVPALEALPAAIAGELVTLAKNLERDIPTTFSALIDVGVQQRLLQMRAEERVAILAEHDARREKHANDNEPT